MGNSPSTEGQAQPQEYSTLDRLDIPFHSFPVASQPRPAIVSSSTFSSLAPPSASAPTKRPPQKLSKPHVIGGRRLADDSAATLLNPTGFVSTSRLSRFSGSHNRKSFVGNPVSALPCRPDIPSGNPSLAGVLSEPSDHPTIFPDYAETAPEPDHEEGEEEKEEQKEDGEKEDLDGMMMVSPTNQQPPPPPPSRRQSLLRTLSMRSTWSRKSEKSVSNLSSDDSACSTTTNIGYGRARARSMTHESLQAHALTRQGTDGSLPTIVPKRDSIGHNQTSWGAPRRHSRANSIQRDQDFTFRPPVPPVPAAGEFSTTPATSAATTLSQLTSSHPVSRVNSDMSIYTPMRRRSIVQTPGVATRAPWTVPPVPTNQRHGSYATTPALSRRNSVVSTPGTGGDLSWPLPAQLPPMPVPVAIPMPGTRDDVDRVETPCEDEYKQLGGIRFGSLRIINGSPMLSPAVEQEAWIDTKTSKAQAGPGLNNNDDDDDDSEDDVLEIKAPRPKSSVTVTVKPPPPTLVKGIVHSNTTEMKKTTLLPKVVYPVGYREASLASPVPSPISPHLVTTSKHTAVEDDLFENDSDSDSVNSPEYSPLEVLSIREDPSAKASLPERPHIDPSQRPLKTDGNDSGSGSSVVPSPTSPAGHRPEKPLAKADSGYSSNVSLRSLKPHSNMSGRTLSKKMKKKSKAEKADDMASFMGELQAMSQSGPKPDELRLHMPQTVTGTVTGAVSAVPSSLKKDNVAPLSPKSIQRTVSLAPHCATSHSAPGPVAELVPVPLTSHSNLPKDAESNQHSPVSLESDVVIASSDGEIPRRPGRLRRLLSGGSSKGSPSTRAALQDASNDVPPVPKLLTKEQARRRTGFFAGLSARPKLRPAASNWTLGTILSVGSMEISSAADSNTAAPRLSPAVNKPGGAWRQSSARRLSLQKFTQGIMPVRKSVSRNSATPRKFLSRRERPMAAAYSARAVTIPVHGTSKVLATDGDGPVLETQKVDLDARITTTTTTTTVEQIGTDYNSHISPFDQAFGAFNADGASFGPRPRTMSMRDGRDLHRIRAEFLPPNLPADSIQSDGRRVPLAVRPAHRDEEHVAAHTPSSRLRLRRSMGQLRRSLMLRPQTSHDRLPRSGTISEPSHPMASSTEPRRAMSLASEQFAGLGITGAEVHGTATVETKDGSASSWYGSTADSPQSPQTYRFGNSPQQGLRSRYGWSPDAVAPVHQSPHRGTTHRRGGSEGYGTGAPYRVLHSYNSPAYRNVPIWG